MRRAHLLLALLATSALAYERLQGPTELLFHDKAKAHAKLGREAQAEEDAEKALKKWREIFGDRFPAPAQSESKADSLLSSASIPGGLSFPDRPITPRRPGGFG